MGETDKMKREKELETVIVIVLGLTAVYWLGRREIVLLECALVIGAAALAAPAFARGLHWAWMGLAKVMGEISGRVLLTVVYVVVLVPLSYFAKLAGKVSMKLKPGGETYFKERDHAYSKEDMIHPW
jgi:hypothetical protein